MFRIDINDIKTFRLVIDAISQIIDEGAFHITEEGIKVRAMDPPHVAMIMLDLHKEAFDKYEIDEERVIGLDLERLKTILRRAQPEDLLKIESDEKKNLFTLTFEGASRRSFTLPLLDMPESEFKVPNLEFDAFVEIRSEVLKNAINDARIVGDLLVFEVDSEKLSMRSWGDLGELDIELDRESEGLIDLDVKKNAKSMFNVDYLQNMMVPVPTTDTVKLSLGTDLPLELRFDIPNGNITYLLAPRVESG
ncbi:MAG: proliferating cell nuclear antigen (pcna) [Candidatus Hydrothermarchaeota archaeon]